MGLGCIRKMVKVIHKTAIRWKCKIHEIRHFKKYQNKLNRLFCMKIGVPKPKSGAEKDLPDLQNRQL
jgi:hypothetical protein